MFYLLEKIR